MTQDKIIETSIQALLMGFSIFTDAFVQYAKDELDFKKELIKKLDTITNEIDKLNLK